MREFLITLWCGPRWQFRPNLCPKKFLLLNFTRILWFFWDLGITLFDIYEDSVFAEIFILGKFFGFPGETWTPKWTKTVNFGCFSLESKFKILKNFSIFQTIFQDQTIFGGVRVQIAPAPPFSPKKGPFHGCWIFNNITTTTAILMKLTAELYLNKVFHLAESWGITHRV